MPNKADFQAMADQFCSAFNAGQPAAAMGAYAEDAWVVSPEGEVAIGHDQIRAYWIRQAEIRGELKATVDEVHSLSEDVIRCILSSTATEKASNRSLIGKGLAILRSSGTEWKLVAHAWAHH
jgi:ketosteroid isomerase-like protein